MTPFCTSTILALALVTSDVSVKNDTGDALVRSAMKQVGVSMEILDPREMKYVFLEQNKFVPDLQYLRQRYNELADAPPAWDANRFPGREAVNEWITFNRHYRQFLQERLRIVQVYKEEIEEAIQECDQLYTILDCARDANCGFYYISVRRAALKRLRELIGPDAYYAGAMPPIVPVWRFCHAN